MTAIITGINGQDGFYLKELLERNKFNVISISRDSEYNISQYDDIAACFNKYKPLFVFHLAANSTTRHESLFENHQIISTGTLNILEAVKKNSPHTKVFIAGSGLQFKNVGNPIKETDPFDARDVYSVSRIHSVYAARYYRSLGIKADVGYLFNHDSPRRTERHMAKKISEAAKRIATGQIQTLEIGDISVVKEWTFAEDIVNGIWAFVNQDHVYEANISSGIGYSIENWLELCFGFVGKDWKEYVVLNDNFKADYKILISDPSLIFSLGWQPRTSFEQLAKLMMQ